MAGGQTLDQLPYFPDLGRIQTDGRLVEDQDIRFIDKGVGESHALAITLGERADQMTPDMTDEAEVEGVIHLLPHPSRADPFERGTVTEVFPHAHFGVEGHILRQVADSGTGLEGLAEDIEASDLNLPRIRRKEAAEDFHRGALACPIRSKEADYLAAIDRKGKVPNGIGGTIAFGESLDRDHEKQGRDENLSAE